MTRTEELLKLCDEAGTFCNKCGYFGKDEPTHKRPGIGDECAYQAARIMYVHPETIKQLVELVRLQHEALKDAVVDEDITFGPAYEGAKRRINKAKKAFNRFEQGGE